MESSRYTLIKGSFHILYPDLPGQGPEPDGDTITFMPDNIDLIKNFKRKADITKREMIKIRFEAIDALETHFPAPGGMTHQQEHYAFTARDFMLESLGFKDIVYSSSNSHKIESANANFMVGYILANEVDVYGRVIALVYPGNAKEEDGANIYVDEQVLQSSINYKLFFEGLAYPALYTSLPISLIDYIAKEVKSIREEKKGLWLEEDCNTELSVKINGLDDLQELIIWPKLFRRLVVFYKKGYNGLDNFIPWLHDNVDGVDDELILPNREKGNLHDLFIVNDGAIKLRYYPEDVIIIDKAKNRIVT
jgi:hypothetical protein